MVYICIYELCFLYRYCICIIHVCSSLVEEIKNIIIIIVLKAEPGKLDIKRREPGILFIGLPIVSLFKLAIMTYFCVDSAS